MRRRRPLMADYGVPDDEAGMLEWPWAEERLVASKDYWVATTHPDGRPNVTPVWGVWTEGVLWFSCAPRSRKARNLDRDPRCTFTTADPEEPVIVEGVAERIDRAQEMADAVMAKYGGEYTAQFFTDNALFAVRPTKVVAMREADFTTSPTCWTF